MRPMKKVVIAAIALSLSAGVANAAPRKHKRVVRHHHPVIVRPVAPPYASYYRPGPRPPWAAPWQCFTDEGYGRYRPCDAGPSSIN